MEEAFTNEVKRVTFGNFDFYIGKGAARFHRNDKTMYMGNTKKGHHEGIIRIIAALHDISQETGATSFNLIITSPFTSMAKDKDFFAKRMDGVCESLIDGKSFKFTIENIRVMAEGLGALAFAGVRDCVVVDAGSMTMNILHLIDGKINARRSITLNGGTIKNDVFQLATDFSKASTDVEFDHHIVVTGGKSEEMSEALESIGYENVNPILLKDYPSYYANVVGLFMVFEKKFESVFA
jgi:plasmid segregation protein ParM